jgi:hypothetical protein
MIANGSRVRTGKGRGLQALAFERKKETDGRAVDAGYRPQIDNVRSRRWQNDPVTAPHVNYRANLKTALCSQTVNLLAESVLLTEDRTASLSILLP